MARAMAPAPAALSEAITSSNPAGVVPEAPLAPAWFSVKVPQAVSPACGAPGTACRMYAVAVGLAEIAEGVDAGEVGAAG